MNKNYRIIALTAITAKVYGDQLLSCIQHEVKKNNSLETQNSFRRNQWIRSEILTILDLSKYVHKILRHHNFA